ncbi:PEP-CTERM sorting domain-containing protein [Aeoliella sp. SH292]|uniref:PEP-CTERM sorting domain-containing protein n=1 Tax=Aeoliella sp. SH292 TaxID=3454464 RepID=UPI003F9493F1
MMWRTVSVVCLVACSMGVHAAAQQPIAFTEDFATSTSQWATGTYGAPSYQAAGGPDGSGFIRNDSLTFNNFTVGFGGTATAILFRGENSINSSNDAFVANWIDEGYTSFSYFFKHNAPVALELFTRFANSGNNRGASVTNGQLVQPGVWTEVVLDLNRGSSEIISYGSAGSLADPYGAVFGSAHGGTGIGNIQISVNRPAGLTPEQLAAPLMFELDKVSVHVPEPSTIMLIGIGMLLVAGRLGLHRAVR